MKNTARYLIATTAIVLSLTATKSTAFADNLDELTADWWQWAFSIPASENPLLELDTETDGARCMIGQRGPVWFLAGTLLGGTARRTCEVPEDRWLFFPVVNATAFDSPGLCGQDKNEHFSVKEIRADADQSIDGVTVATATLEPVNRRRQSRNLNVQRVRSVVFSIAFPEDNLYEFLLPDPDPNNPKDPNRCPAGIYSPAADDGKYVLLEPLPVGQYALHIHAKNSSGFKLDVTYELNIVPVKRK